MSGTENCKCNGNSNGSETSDSKHLVQEQLTSLRQKAAESPLSPKDLTEGLLTIGEVTEAALVQAIHNSAKLERLQKQGSNGESTLSVLREQMSQVIAKVETTNLFMDRIDRNLAEGLKSVQVELKGLKEETQELKTLVLSIAAKLGVPNHSESSSDCKISVLKGGDEV